MSVKIQTRAPPERLGPSKRTKSSRELIQFWESKTDGLPKNKSMVYTQPELDALLLLAQDPISLKNYTSPSHPTLSPVVDDAEREAQDHLQQDANVPLLASNDASVDTNAPLGCIPENDSYDQAVDTISEALQQASATVSPDQQASVTEQHTSVTTLDHDIELQPPPLHAPDQPLLDNILSVDQPSPTSPLATASNEIPSQNFSTTQSTHGETHDLRMQQKEKAIKRLESLGYDPYKGVYVAHRKHLMQDKMKAITRLESMGYDPYQGLYAAHRKHLMQDKMKVITRLESMGYDPYKGVYAAHRPVLMEIKNKVVVKLEQMGFDPKGQYAAHRYFLMKEKEKVIARLTALGFDPFKGDKQNYS